MDSSQRAYIDRWVKYLANYPSNSPIKRLEESLANITAGRLKGPDRNSEMWSEIGRMLIAKITELKQKRGEPK